MVGYSSILRSVTKGEGEFDMKFDSYEFVSQNVLEEILREI